MRRTLARRASAALLSVLALVGCLAAVPARAATEVDAKETGWQVDWVPYLFLSKINGKTGLKGETIRVDVDYKELFDLIGNHFSLLAGMGHLEVRHDRIFGFLDIMATTLNTSKAAHLEGVERDDLHTGKIHADVELSQDTTTFEWGGGYRLLRLAMPNRTVPFRLDALAGGRYYNYWSSVHATASTKVHGVPDGPRAVERAIAAHGSVDWIDPFVGGRFTVPLTDDIEFSFRGDIGGFGVGSDLAWDIVTGLKYRIPYEPLGIHPWFALGYKVLSYDYDKNGVLIDLTFQGPVTGIGLTF
jgi:hypothetical protein